MMKRILLAGLMGMACALAPAAADSAVTMQASALNQGEQQIRLFLDTLKAGKADAAIDGLLANSKLWSQKTGVREQMLAQINAATGIYGPITDYELADTQKLGTMVIRQYYLVQHRDMVTRWEFDLVRSGAGWTIGYFGFNDQPATWF